MSMRQKGVALILFLTFLITVTAGCNLSQSANSANLDQPISGGQLVYGTTQEPASLNPLFIPMGGSNDAAGLIFNGLVTYNGDMQWEPDLATTVPTVENGGVSPDGLTVTYTLRQDVKWHDGLPFTSEDVKFTWQAIMDPKVSANKEGYDQIASIETPDKYTVVVKFKKPYPPYLRLFSTGTNGMIIPKHMFSTTTEVNTAKFNREPIGTGPFKFKEWRPGDYILLEANNEYYKAKPYLERIVYKIVPDAEALLAQFKTGEVDVVPRFAFSMYDAIKAIEGVQVYANPGMGWEELGFNLQNQLFQDPLVRQAIAYSIDRQEIVNTVLNGTAKVATGDQVPLSWAYNPNIQPFPRDIAKAKALFAQAGWKPGPDGILVKDGKKMTFTITTTAGNQVREAVEQAIQKQLREVGVQVEIANVKADVFFGDTLRNRNFDTMLVTTLVGEDPTDYTLWHSKQIPSRENGWAGQNYVGWRNAEVDQLLDSIGQTLDMNARKNAYYRIQELINTEFPIIPLYYRVNLDAAKSSLQNFKPNPLPYGNTWNAHQWWIKPAAKK